MHKKTNITVSKHQVLARPQESEAQNAPAPLAYEPPRLVRVGTLRDLLAGTTGTVNDGPAGGQHNTGP
jgi:hypothetical protein